MQQRRHRRIIQTVIITMHAHGPAPTPSAPMDCSIATKLPAWVGLNTDISHAAHDPATIPPEPKPIRWINHNHTGLQQQIAKRTVKIAKTMKSNGNMVMNLTLQFVGYHSYTPTASLALLSWNPQGFPLGFSLGYPPFPFHRDCHNQAFWIQTYPYMAWFICKTVLLSGA